MSAVEQPQSTALEQDVRHRSNLTTSQFLIWLDQQVSPDVPLYNMIQTFAIDGAVDRVAFERAFADLVAASDILRSTFAAVDGVPHRIAV